MGAASSPSTVSEVAVALKEEAAGAGVGAAGASSVAISLLVLVTAAGVVAARFVVGASAAPPGAPRFPPRKVRPEAKENKQN